MRILALDPGAERCGYAVIDRDKDPVLVETNILQQTKRGKLDFQEYRLVLEEANWQRLSSLVQFFEPDYVVNETLPPMFGGSNNSTQNYLVNTVITTLHCVALFYHVPVFQVSARSVQSKIAIKGRSEKITKPQVRNGVLQQFPELKDRAAEWTKLGHWDALDACAIGLYAINYVLV